MHLHHRAECITKLLQGDGSSANILPRPLYRGHHKDVASIQLSIRHVIVCLETSAGGGDQGVRHTTREERPTNITQTGNFCENIGIYLKRLIMYDFTVPPHIFISYFI